jgi:hypothetical protein
MRVAFLINKDIPMLDHVAPVMGYGRSDPVNTCFLRCQFARLELKYSQANVPLVISLTSLAKLPGLYADRSLAEYELYPLALSFLSLSLAENALVTGLIISKILTVYREIRGLESRVGLGRDLVPIISILIESGVITFMVQLVQTLMYKFDVTAFPILGALAIQLYVRNFTVNCRFNGF